MLSYNAGSDVDALVLVMLPKLALLLLLQLLDLSACQRIVDEEHQRHQREQYGGDQRGQVVHLLEILQRLYGALFILVVHAQQRPVAQTAESTWPSLRKKLKTE